MAQEKGKLKRAVIVLGCICLGSGAGVGSLYALMKGDIEAQSQRVFRQTLAVVLGQAEEYPAVGEYPEGTADQDKVYANASGSGILYAAMGTAQGYQSQVKVLVAVEARAPGAPVEADPVVHAVAVVESQETPGLGENVKAVAQEESLWARLFGGSRGDLSPKRPWFQEQFSGKRLSELVVEKRADTDKIAAITGATITSHATTQAVRNAVEKIVEKTAGMTGR